MKKILLFACAVCLSLGAMADDQQKVDGSKVARISFSGDNVIVTYTDGTSGTYDMADIVIDMSSATSIEERVAQTTKAGIEGKQVYDLGGKLVGTSAARLQRGVYVVDGKKVIIK